jgi:hypothetical protein
MSPFASPFDDSRAPSRAGSDEELNTQTVSEKYNILPSAGLLLFPEDVEKDDWLHNPDPNEKEKRDCDIFTRRGLVNVGGLALISIGVLLLFIGYPILTFVHKMSSPSVGPCTHNPMCIDVPKVPLLKNVRTGLIDPDTPDHAMNRKAHDGAKQNLVVCALALFEYTTLIFHSFLTSSTSTGEPSMMATIPSSRPWTSGTE